MRQRNAPSVTSSCVASCRIDVPRSFIALATITCSLVSFTHSLRVGGSNPEGIRSRGSRQELRCVKLDVPRAAKWGCLLHHIPTDTELPDQRSLADPLFQIVPEQHPRLLSVHGASEESVEGATAVGSAPVRQTVANRGRASTARCPILVRRMCRIYARR